MSDLSPTSSTHTTPAGDHKALRRELRETRKALQTLSDAVLLHMHFIDTKVGPDKTVPREVSKRLGQLVGYLDLVNDTVRFGSLKVNFRTDNKAKVIAKLLQRTGIPAHEPPSAPPSSNVTPE